MRELNHDNDGWLITIERNDSEVVIHRSVPNDDLEYAVDDALREARDADRKAKGINDGAVLLGES